MCVNSSHDFSVEKTKEQCNEESLKERNVKYYYEFTVLDRHVTDSSIHLGGAAISYKPKPPTSFPFRYKFPNSNTNPNLETLALISTLTVTLILITFITLTLILSLTLIL